MFAARAPMMIYQGNDYTAAVVVSDSNGGNANLAGYTIAAQIRRGVADRNPDIVLTIATSVTLPNVINLSIASADTGALIGPYVWDLQLTAPGGIVQTILRGQVAITPQITR
jgi:hypothetical protein